MKRIIDYSDNDDDESGEDEEMDADHSGVSEDEDMDSNMMDSEEGEAEVEESVEEEVNTKKLLPTKRTLKDRMKEEQEIRNKEARMRTGNYEPTDIDDFERMLVSN